MAQLFDASEFIDPQAITASLNEVRNFQLQPSAPAQRQAPQMQPNQSVMQPPQQQQDQSSGILGTILSVFM